MTDGKDHVSKQELAQRARDSLRDTALPDDVQRRLRLARSAALERIGDDSQQRIFGYGRWLLPAGAAATLLIAVLMTMTGDDATDVMPMLDEQELMAATDMELLEDIEFLAWMLEEENVGVIPDDG